MHYAKNTDVSSDRSLAEIQRILRRYGAEGFMYGWSGQQALVAFEMAHRRVQFMLPMPDRNSRQFLKTETGRQRKASAADAAYEQAIRQRWRALALVIKAKLEAVDSGIVTFEQEFLAHFVIPGKGTVGQVLIPQLDHAINSKLPPLLPGSNNAEN